MERPTSKSMYSSCAFVAYQAMHGISWNLILKKLLTNTFAVCTNFQGDPAATKAAAQKCDSAGGCFVQRGETEDISF